MVAAVNDKPAMVDARFVAAAFGVSERTARRMARDPEWSRRLGALPVLGQWRFSRECVESLTSPRRN